MKRAIRTYLPSFLAVTAVMLLGIGVGAYILSNQRLRFPLVEESPKKIDAVLSNAQAVQPGQGQSVRVAGVTIGAIGPVRLEDGRAVVTLEIEPEFKDLVKDDATALLRSKTGLKDMFLEVDPGHGKTLPAGGQIALSDTLPDVNLDEVLAVLDSDTRPYLQLLINGGGKGTQGRGQDLSRTLRQLGPLQRDTRRVSGALAQRKANLRRLVNRYGRLTEEVGASDRDLVRLVRASNVVFSSFADERSNLSSAVGQLPGTLRQTRTTLDDVRAFSTRLGPALQALRPTVRELDPATRAVLPLAREGTPIVRDRLRPLARAAPARLNTLGGAAGDFATAAPDLTTSLAKVNRLLNMAAFNPGGAESLEGKTFDQQRNRQEGYLYWAGWVAQTGGSLFGTADGQGVFRRFTGGAVNCGTLTGLALPAAVTDLLGDAGLCSP
ncbi:MAG TPA: MlaD family protein [Thermoleophilaceae bacterium]|nr:MlaD family protein [Thermoleophilaceae bacterium]